MIRAFMTLIDVLWIVLAIVGLMISFVGYKQGVKKAAFILFMVYFGSSIYAHTLNRPVTRWLASRRSHEITHEQLKQYAQMEEEMNALYLKHSMVEPATAVSYINFPFGQTILVAGVWMMVKQKKEP